MRRFGLTEGINKRKDGFSFNYNGIIQKALRWTKENYKNIFCVTDVCMCEYTSHGHCGILNGEYVDNDKTLDALAKISVSHAEAGSDMIAPSDMMDGRILAIRRALDAADFCNTPIMSYSSKFASAFYGPFRAAADSAPAFGDRKTYQMDGHNGREALNETLIDIEEGADIVMVKPALAYLDVIKTVKENVNVPVAAYSVSGEYAMIKAAAKAGFIDEENIICESAVSIFRAGADILISYYSAELARFIGEGRIG
ncbi:delta-aminolevulinic acid dehydratase [Spirochaetia bacterium]|nr:delta-aminolevulinic acid dehydratase [Spirochaetia bacterium]